MSIAWTTVIVIILLLPGVFFFVGFAIRERYSREVVRSTVIAEVALALLVAIVLHASAWSTLTHVFRLNARTVFRPVAEYDRLSSWLMFEYVAEWVWPLVVYVIVTAIMGGLLGCLGAWLVVRGPLRFLATHKWVYQILNFSSRRRGRIVTAYVMSTTSEAGRVLMYKGRLQELYLSAEGKIAYLVLRNCARYVMKLDADEPTTGTQLPLFSSSDAQRSWDYLMISGENIANVLFDPSPIIEPTKKGTEALERAVEDLARMVREELSKNPADRPRSRRRRPEIG